MLQAIVGFAVNEQTGHCENNADDNNKDKPRKLFLSMIIFQFSNPNLIKKTITEK